MSPPMPRRPAAGLTLVELMVALLVGMLLTLAAFGVLSNFEGRKRTLTAANDIEQAGQVAMYRIDHWIRSAGAGLPAASSFAYGCPLRAAKAGVQLLPRSGLDAPFSSVNPGGGVFRLAPVLILPGQTTPGVSGSASDVLVLMATMPGGGTYTAFSQAADTQTLNLANSVDFGAADLVLVGDQQPEASGALKPCMVQQVAAGFSGGSGGAVSLGGSYYAGSISGTSLADYTDGGFAVRLGNVSVNSPPSFMLLGVGDNNVLYSYDLLATSGTPLQAQADGVFEMHALYGVDTNNDGTIDAWVSPASGSYTVAALSAGNASAAKLLRQIKAVRVGLITRTALPEKTEVSTGPLTLFSDLDDLAYSRTLSAAERHYRYRTIETIVPVRNNML